jgi:hypothetical protein
MERQKDVVVKRKYGWRLSWTIPKDDEYKPDKYMPFVMTHWRPRSKRGIAAASSAIYVDPNIDDESKLIHVIKQ